MSERAGQPVNRDQVNHGPPWLPPAHHRRRAERAWFWVVAIMTLAALVLFGWRALLSIAICGIAASVVYALIGWGLRNVRSQRGVDSLWHVLALGLLLGLCLPVLTDPRLPALMGAALGAVAHVLGRTHWLRASPVAAVMCALLAAALAAPVGTWSVRPALQTEQGALLKPNRAVLGDVSDAPARGEGEHTAAEALPLTPWWARMATADEPEARWRPAPARTFAMHYRDYLSEPARFREALRRAALLPLWEVVLGVVPGAVGATSVVLLMVLGLWLMHQRLARLGTALAALVGALAAIALLPIPMQGEWVWAWAQLGAMGAPLAIAFVGYALLALPLPVIVLVLMPDGAPMSATGRLIFGLIVGAGAIAGVWWLGRPEAAFLGLLLAGLLARPMDHLRRDVMRA